jgi:hypothetical protein
MEKDAWRSAERMLREYGERAEEECAARADYHALQDDKAEAGKWTVVGQAVQRLRQGEKPPA